jgi:hypothetical protein
MRKLLLPFLLIPVLVNAQWLQTSGPTDFGSNVYCLLGSGDNLFAGTQGNLFLSPNSGESWDLDTTGFNIPPNTWYGINTLFEMNNYIFAAQASNVYRSTNNGNSWTMVSTLNSFSSLRFASIGNNLFAGIWGGAGVYVSSDSGLSWTAAGSGITSNYVNTLVANGSNLFAGSNGIFLSTDNGLSWTPVNTGLTNLNVLSLAVNGDNVYAATQGGVFISNNNGTNWTAINNGLVDSTSLTTIAFLGNKLFAGTYNGVYISNNNGASWSNVSNGLPNLFVTSFASLGSNIFAGTSGAGVFKAAINALSTIDDITINVSQVNIFPNPFSIKTTLQADKYFHNATLTINNCFGQSVKQIKNISGQTIILSRDNLPSGLYFVHLKQDNQDIVTKKIIITD